jgi:hypothetical protein
MINKSMKQYYVYLLTDPRNNNQVFYCGKGSGNRWKDHLQNNSGLGNNNPTVNKIKKMQDEGHQPGVIFLHENISDESLAYELETKYIESNFDSLTNIKIEARPPSAAGRTAWNKGIPRDLKVTEKISKKQIGQKRTFKDPDTWRKNVSESLKGDKHPMFGKPAHNRRSIIETTTNQEFTDQISAATILNIKQSDISNCLAGRQKSVKGYKFIYKGQL